MHTIVLAVICIILTSCDRTEKSTQNSSPASSLRIISLAPSLTEWAFALNAGEQLIARTDQCDQPAGASHLPSVGSLFPAQIERILSYQPTDVLMIEGHELLKEQLQRLGIRVHTLQPKKLEDMMDHAKYLGSLFSREDEALAWINSAQRRIKKLAPLKTRVSVVIELWHSPLTVAGRESYMGDLVHTAGGRLLPTGLGDWPTLSMERLITMNPQLLLLSSDALYSSLMEDEPARPWTTLKAIKDKSVFKLEGRLSRPVPKVIDELEWLHTLFKGLTGEAPSPESHPHE